MEISDPLLPDLVRRADAGEKIIETTEFSQTQESNEDDSHEEKVEAMAGIIYRAGDEATAALFVLMGTLETSAHPKLLANAAKAAKSEMATRVVTQDNAEARLDLKGFRYWRTLSGLIPRFSFLEPWAEIS